MEAELTEILGYRRLTEGLATAGQPTAPQIASIARAGFKTLINLALPSSPRALPNEAELAAAAGLRYVHVPIHFEEPEVERAAEFFDALSAAREEPVFVHCAMNMRVSALLYVYRVAVQRLAPELVRRDLLAIWQPKEVWRRYMSEVARRAVRRPLELETPRLLLREFAAGDGPAIHAYAGDEEVTRLMIWGPNTLEQTEAFLTQKLAEPIDPRCRILDFALIEKASGELIGGVSLREQRAEHREADIGYVLRRASWGRGLVAEACEQLLELGFGVFGYHRIWATANAKNRQSQRVMEKLGMRYEGTAVQSEYVKGEFRDVVTYAMLEDEYWSMRPSP